MIIQKFLLEEEGHKIVTFSRSGKDQVWIKNDGTIVDMKLVDTVIDICLRNIAENLPPVYLYLNAKDLFYTDSPYVDTMATDGRSIFINPAWVELILTELGRGRGAVAIEFTLVHEVMHIVFHHTVDEKNARDKFPDHMRANIAQDLEINYWIENYANTKSEPDYFKGISKDAGLLYDEKFSDMTWESIYPEINVPDKKDKQKKKMPEKFKRGFEDAIAGYFDKLRKEKVIEHYEIK